MSAELRQYPISQVRACYSVVFLLYSILLFDMQREEEETCTPPLKHKEKREDKSLQLKKVFNELAEELKVIFVVFIGLNLRM
jgi:hypothetical protein